MKINHIFLKIKKYKISIGLVTTALFVASISYYFGSPNKKIKQPVIIKSDVFKDIKEAVRDKTLFKTNEEIALADSTYIEIVSVLTELLEHAGNDVLALSIATHIGQLYLQYKGTFFHDSNFSIESRELEDRCRDMLLEKIKDINIGFSSAITIPVKICKKETEDFILLNINLTITNDITEDHRGIYASYCDTPISLA